MPKSVKWEKITDLYINSNPISELPSYIGKLKTLKCLQLSKTRITSVPASIMELVHLEELDLSRNSLTELPEGIFDRLVALKKLDVRYAYNTITRITITLQKFFSHPPDLTNLI